MAKDEGTSNSTTPVEKGLSILERAWDAHWALRLICVVLFFDMAMMLRVQRGLWQWQTGDANLFKDIGWLAVTVVAFSFVVAIVMPMLLTLLQQLGWFIATWLPRFPSADDQRPYQRPLGRVPAYKLLDLALREKDAFLLRMVETHEQQRAARRQTRERAGELTAAALLAALADWALAQWIPGSVGLIGALIERLADWAPIATVGVVLYAGAMLKWAWFPPEPPILIYYPPLDRELREKEEEDRRLR